ncbi:MAG: hypothetical protein NDJ75_02190 [Thermoanaerobaculia bacterium]|nr:hypothetical protein [Thermoanaerobaculia bacterium]
MLMLPWWNRYLGLSLDGYMPWYGHRILGGEIPYRDFFLHLPPLHPLGEAALEAVAGRSIVAGRLAGALLHMAMAAVVAGWLARFYRPGFAVFATVAALAVAMADDTEILDLYNPHAALAAVLSGLAATRALAGEHRRAAGWLAGAAAGIAFWLKQTVGLGATVAVPLALGLLAVRDADRRRALGVLTARFAGGWLAVALLIGGWLAWHGAFTAFLQQVFLDAAGSKGSPLELLARPWLAPFELPRLATAAWLALAGAVLSIARPSRAPEDPAPPRPWRGPLVALVAVALLVEASRRLATAPHSLVGERHAWLELLRTTRQFALLFALYGITLLGLRDGLAALRRRLADGEPERLLFAAVAAAVAVTQSLSFSATGAAAFPSLALVAAYGAEVGRRRRYRFRSLPMAAIVTVAFVAASTLHLEAPFDFAGWREPGPASATASAREPALAGMRLSPGTARDVDVVLTAIRAASDPGEPIFTFPVYPIFYWLADRPPATFASLHWIDVTPDRVVAEDLAGLLAAPPVVVVRQALMQRRLEQNEAYFRGGRASAVRRMNDELERLLRARYRKVAIARGHTYRGQPPLEVWVRSDRVAARRLRTLD